MEHIENKSPFLIVALGDFSARMQGWYRNSITTFEGCKIDMATSPFCLCPTVKEPTHILNNSVSCIDLISKSQPNFVILSGVHPSLHPNCHHQIVTIKVSSQNATSLFFLYPPPYKGLVWHYQQTNTDLIKRAIELFDWESLSNLDVNKQVSIFNETIMNIFKNFIPHKTITGNNKNPLWTNKLKHLLRKNPPWINKLKHLLWKNPPWTNKLKHLLRKNPPWINKLKHLLRKNPPWINKLKHLLRKNPPWTNKLKHLLWKKRSL